MPTMRFYPFTATNGTVGRYPATTSAVAILQNTSTNSYVYVDRGSSSTVYGTLSVNFSSATIEGKIGSNSKIKSCKFGIYYAGFDSTQFYYCLATMTLNNRTLVSAGNNVEGVYADQNQTHINNVVTGKAWVASDFTEDIVLSLETDGWDGIKVAYVYVDITYIAHEIENTPLGKIKIKVPSGIITVPFFNISYLAYPALKIKTPKGIGAFCLVDITDQYASTIRIKTPKGIKAIAYQK